MASGKDGHIPVQGLIPPPAATPRRRSPLFMNPFEMSMTTVEGSRPQSLSSQPASAQSRSDSLEDEPKVGMRPSPENKSARKTVVGISQSVFTNESAPVIPPSLEGLRLSLPSAQPSSTTNHPDLEGLDFSGAFTMPGGDSRPRSASMEDLKSDRKNIYPDIRHVFMELTTNQTSSPTQFVINSGGGQVPRSRSALGTCSTPPPVCSYATTSYGWNPSVINSSALPTNQTKGFPGLPYDPFATNCPPFVNRLDNSNSYNSVSQNTSIFHGNNSFSNFSSSNKKPGLLGPNTQNLFASAAYDANPLNGKTAQTVSYIPNIALPRPASMNDVLDAGRESSQSPTDNQTAPTVIAGFEENLLYPNLNLGPIADGNLIKLEQALPEHEYLTLEYFDPLYSRARRESFFPDGGSPPKDADFTFGEAFPSLYNNHPGPLTAAYDHQNDDHIWLPRDNLASSQEGNSKDIGFEIFDFDTYGHVTFGQSEKEFLKEAAMPEFSTAAYDSAPSHNLKPKSEEKPKRPPSWRAPKGKNYERLRKRTFIDPESESFCQMVVNLKKKYLSTDEKTNPGYLINQIGESHMGSIQVKVTVHTQFSSDPVVFTCDTSTLVEHVIGHVLCSLSPNDGELNTDRYILRVYGRAEYLRNDLPLAKFDYTHSCLKIDHDIALELITIEEVSRPFIRTRDDDSQILYFPKEYINADGTSISQDALAVYIDTFYHEVDVLLEHFNRGGYGVFHSQGLIQSVKAICVNLARVETVEITKAIEKLERNLAEFMNPSSKVQNMYGKSHDKETQDAINVALRCSLVEDVKDTVEQLMEAVKRLVRMYCNTFLTDFFLGSSIEIPHDHLEVVQLQEVFIVCISSAHRIPSAWKNRFEEYKIVCSLYHGSKRLVPDISTSLKPQSKGLCERICWDEWLQFDKTYLCLIPRETRLCLMLCGTRSTQAAAADKGEVTAEGKKLVFPLGAAAIQLFNEKGYLNQGPQLVPLMMGASSDPIMPSCKTLLPDSVLLQVNLPDFDRTIFFPEPLNSSGSPVRSFDLLTPAIRSLVANVMEKESCLTFSPEELEILWTYRHYMISHPSLLPRILQAAISWDWASLSEIYSLLRTWKPLHPMQAFELLLPQFPDLRVREFAAQSLNKIPTDDLLDFLPQMIQGLKFESYHNSPLAKLLLEQSCKSPRFAHQFFWLLKGAASQDATFKRRYELMFVALASVAGDALYQEFKKQEELVKVMTSVAEKVKDAKDKDGTLRQELVALHQMVERKGRVLLPYNPSVEVVGLDMKSCSYFTSNAFPLKLVFKNSSPKADSHYVIYKVGDDLRQDMLTLQMIRIMDSLWLQNGLDLKMITFACLATGPKKGVIEFIAESETLRKIQVSCGVTGSFKDRPIKEWLQKHNPTELEYKKAVENFTYSCAGYCVATYVLGICDRHNDNIMLKQSGHMFHIDFSKFLGDAQMFGSFKRDRAPFVLTSDMAYVINDGGRPGHRFQHFIDLCCQAYNILRKHADLFRSLFILMARSGIPGVNEHAVQYVQTTLLPGQSDAQATVTFTRMIEESMKSVFTQFNFFIHNLAQLKFSSHNEGALLSFVPKSYSAETDGKIAYVELSGYQKRYTPEKHYIFILKIERENQKVPTYIFRHFSEFVEFRDKLNEMFPLVSWPNFSTRVVIGRSNIRTVAESRKMEIATLLRFLWTKTAEISECTLVYTFFHPLLRDEQEAEKSKLKVTKLREPSLHRLTNSGNSGIQGEIRLSIQYKKNALQVMIMHVRGLPEVSQLPSPYVKTYLLPDPDKQTKLKTKTVKNTSHPTYNELFQYELTRQEIMYRVLQVTVWDRDMLKENNFLGAVYVRLRDLDLDKDNSGWHPLGRIQMPEF